MAKIYLHEVFNGAPSLGILKAQGSGNLDLHVERKLFNGTVGDQVQVAADGPEERLGIDERLVLFLGENTVNDQFVRVFGVVKILRNPEQRLQIAQPAFAFFDVRFNHVTGIPVAFVPHVALFQLGFDKFRPRIFEKLLPEADLQIDGQCFVAGDVTVFQ